MMKKFFMLQPRNSGKTTKAIYEYLKSPEDTLFICNKIKNMFYLKNIINQNSIFSSKEFLNKKLYLDNKYKRIILDEYLYFDKEHEIYNRITQSTHIEELFIFSTAKKYYDKNLFYFIKNNKMNLSYSEIEKNLVKEIGNLSINFQNDIYELYYNFITDEDVVLIDVLFSNNINYELKKIVGEEIFDLQICNNYLKTIYKKI